MAGPARGRFRPETREGMASGAPPGGRTSLKYELAAYHTMGDKAHCPAGSECVDKDDKWDEWLENPKKRKLTPKGDAFHTSSNE